MSKFGELIDLEVPVLIDFYAEWSEPSIAMHPVLKDVAAALSPTTSCADGVPVRSFGLLGPEGLLALSLVVELCGLHACWPSGTASVFVTLLPKPDGGLGRPAYSERCRD